MTSTEWKGELIRALQQLQPPFEYLPLNGSFQYFEILSNVVLALSLKAFYLTFVVASLYYN
jgi:hypothetical protein